MERVCESTASESSRCREVSRAGTSSTVSVGTTPDIRVLKVCSSEQGENSNGAFNVDACKFKLQNEAFNILAQTGIEPVWNTVEDVLSVEQKVKDVFVLPTFQGHLFHHLTGLGCRIFGPRLCIDLLNSGELIPKIDHPVYCKAMQGAIVSFSGLTPDKRKKLKEKVRWMNGKFLPYLDKNTTHLVVPEVGGEKYKAAGENRIAIVTPEWIEEAWSLGQFDAVDTVDYGFYSRFICPIFKGCTICFSGYDKNERDQLVKLVEQNGGIVTGPLKKDDTSHLVTDSGTGQKFRMAVEWGGISIVKAKWVTDSVHMMYCQDADKYLVVRPGLKPKKIISTPEKPFDESRVAEPNCSLIAPTAEPQLHNGSLMSNVSTTGGTQTQKASNFLKPRLAVGGGKAAGPSRRACSEKSIVADSMINGSIEKLRTKMSKSQSLLDSSRNRRTAEMDSAVLKSVDMSISTSGDFLEGCTFCVVGFNSSADATNRIRKIINAGGGSRNQDPTAKKVTHVLIGPDMDEKKVGELGFSSSVWPVTVDWLVECFKQGRRVEEKDYWHPIVKRGIALSPIKNLKIISEDQEGKEEEEIPVLDNVLSQYLPQEEALPQPLPEPEHNENPEREDVEDEEEMDTTEVTRFLEGYKFAIWGFGAKETTDFRYNIEEIYGGVISSENVDYLILPLIKFQGTKARCDVKFREEVTNVWLQMCLEVESLLAVDWNLMFRPLTVTKDWESNKFLTGAVVCLSGFVGTERDSLSDIALRLGACCQEHMSRTNQPKKKLLATTHLIAKTNSGGKYEAAKKWKIPALKASWIIHSLMKGAKEDEQEYDLNLPSPIKPTKRNSEEAGCEDVLEKKRRREGSEGNNMAKIPETMLSEGASPGVSGVTSDGGLRRSSRKSSVKTVHVPTPAMNIRVQELKGLSGKGTPLSGNASATSSPFTPSAFLDKNKSFHPRFNLDSAKRIVGESPAADNLEDSLDTFVRKNLAAAVKNTAVPPNFFLHGTDSPFKSPNGGSPKGKLNFERMEEELDDDNVFAPETFDPHTIPNKVVTPAESDRPSTSKRTTRSSATRSSTQKESEKELKEVWRSPRGSVTPNPEGVAQMKAGEESDRKSGRQLRNMLDQAIAKNKFEKKISTDSLPAEPVSGGSTPTKPRAVSCVLSSALTEKRKNPLSPEKVEEVVNKEGNMEEEKNSLETTEHIDGGVEWKESAPLHMDTGPGLLSEERPPGRKSSKRVVAEGPSLGIPRITEMVSFENVGQKRSFENSRSQRKSTERCTSVGEIASRNSEMAEGKMKEKAEEENKTSTPKPKPRAISFQSTSLNKEEKRFCADVIKKVGGTYVESSDYNAKCSHLILGRPARNEKLLACIASGKFVLHKSYLEACDAAGYFVDESKFEWGSPDLDVTAVAKAKENPASWKLAMACQRWRQQLQMGELGGAYAGWKVILFVDSQKVSGFSRLLTQGGAQVLPPNTTDLSRVSYALVEEKSKKWTEVDKKRMLKGGVKCVRVELISAWLVDSPIDESAFFIDSYRRFLKHKET